MQDMNARNWKKALLGLLAGLGFSAVYGQSPIGVTGYVKEKGNDAALGLATVQAISLPDSTHRTGGVTDFDGKFGFTVPAAGNYLIRLSYIGYNTFTKTVFVPAQGVDLGTLSIEKNAEMLNAVKIEDKAVQGIQLGDTTQFNANAFKTNPDANAEDLVTKMPGVTLQDGKVQAQGEDVKQILIDGKPYFGTDVNAALKNLPADVIDKVQVFDQQSEQARFSGYDDGNTTKTINIVTKADMRDGIFGKVYAGYGYRDKFSAGGNLNWFNGNRRLTVLYQSNNINQQNFATDDLLGVAAGSSGGGGGRRGGGGGGGGGGRPGGPGGGDANDFLVNVRNGISTTHAAGLNYTDQWGKKIKVTGSYFFNWSNTKASQDLRRNYLLTGDSSQTYMESSTSESRNINHRVNFRFEYAIDSFNVLTIIPRLSVQQNSGSSVFSGMGERGGSLLNRTNSDFGSNLFGLNFGNEMVYRHRFAKAGRTLTINANMGYTLNTGSSNLYSNNTYFAGGTPSDTLDQQADLYGNGWNLGSRFVYTEPLGKGHVLQFNYNNSYQNNLSNKQTLNYSDGTQNYDRVDSLLSNALRSNYHTEAGGLGYRFTTKKAQLMANVSYQWSVLNNDNRFPVQTTFRKEFQNVLPMVMFRYNFTQQKNLRIRYTARTSVPSVDKFQAVVNNSNPLLLSTGNPDLKQDYSHQFFLRYSSTSKKSHVFFLLLSATATQNYIGNSTVIATADTTVNGNIFLPAGAQLTSPVNLNGYYNTRAFVTYGVPLNFMKCNLNVNVGGTYSRTPGVINGQTNYSHAPAANLGVTLSSNISKKIDFTVSSQSSLTFVQNTLRKNLNSNYFNQNTRAKVYWDIWKGIVVTSELTHQLYTGLSDGYNQNYFLWNLGLAKKFLKNDAAEFKFTVFDVLNQNNSITRNVTDIYTEDIETVVLNRYFMLTFTYNFRTFKKKEG